MSNYNNHGAQIEFFAYKNSEGNNSLQINIKHPNQFTSDNILGYIIIFSHQLKNTNRAKIEFHKINSDGTSTKIWYMN